MFIFCLPLLTDFECIYIKTKNKKIERNYFFFITIVRDLYFIIIFYHKIFEKKTLIFMRKAVGLCIKYYVGCDSFQTYYSYVHRIRTTIVILYERQLFYHYL